jgi:hypothetical protein
MQAGGKLKGNRRAVLLLVRQYPGFTSKQFAATEEAMEAGLDRYEFARRLPELETASPPLVRASNRQQHPHEKRKELRWFPCAESKYEEEALA